MEQKQDALREESEIKEYTTPEINVLGTVKEFTKGNGGSARDNTDGSPAPRT